MFGSKLQGKSVTLNNTKLQLLHEDPPQGVLHSVMLRQLTRVALMEKPSRQAAYRNETVS